MNLGLNLVGRKAEDVEFTFRRWYSSFIGVCEIPDGIIIEFIDITDDKGNILGTVDLRMKR